MPLRKTDILLGLLFCAPVGSALAGPWATISGIAASAEDATVAVNNPAAMTRFDDWVMDVSSYSFFSESSFEGTASGTGAVFGSDTESTTVIPSASLVLPLKENLWFGLSGSGVGFSDDFGEDWAGRYFIQDYTLAYVSAIPSLAMKVTDKLSIAGSALLTYTLFEQNKAVFNLDPEFDDGSLQLEADGFTLGYSLSALYEVSDRTRVGLVYRSELDPDLDGDLDFSNLSPSTEERLDELGLLDTSVSVSSRSPQSINLGVFHQFENDHRISVDYVWIDFSNFELSEFYFDGEAVRENETKYENINALSLGWNFPVSEKLRVGLGAFITDEMIEDDNRTMLLRLDTATSYGVGVEYAGEKGRVYYATLNYLDLGNAPVTSPELPILGEISGEYTSRDTIYLQLGIRFGKGAW